MGKGPGLYTDIGKLTRDLLTKDFYHDHKFTITSTSPSGLTFTSTGIKKGEQFVGDLNTQFKNDNVIVDMKVDTSSNIYTTITVDEIAQGAKSIFTFTIPDQKNGKGEVHYYHDYAGIATSISLTSSPLVHLNGAVGSEGIAIGGEAAFDTASGTFIKYNAGIGYTKHDFCAALHLTDKGDVVKASYSHIVNPFTRTTVGAEIAHKISSNENTFTMGGMHALDPLTTIKARLCNNGKLGALLQHEWRPKSFVTLSGEINTKALENSVKFGLALALKL